MNNSIFIKFLRNFHVKRKPYLRFYGHETAKAIESKVKTTNIVESKAGNTNIVESKAETTSIVESKAVINEQWKEKITFYMKAYEDMFGITKLKEMHEKVVKAQTDLRKVQVARADVLEQFFQVQKQLQEKRDILQSTPLEDAKYIPIMTQVHELLKKQKSLEAVIARYDQDDRERQTALALAINNSHDYERTYREKNQYISLITGIVGVFLGLVGSSINNWRHRNDIKHFASDIFDQVADLKKSFEKLKQRTILTTNDIASNASSGGGELVEKLLVTLNSQHDVLDDRIKSLESLLNNGRNNNRISSKETYSDVVIEDILNEFERNIQTKLDKHSYVNLGLIGSWAFFSALFVYFIARSN